MLENPRAQSNRNFISKLEIALKERRESQHWIEVLLESEVAKTELFQPPLQEANEIGKILITYTS